MFTQLRRDLFGHDRHVRMRMFELGDHENVLFDLPLGGLTEACQHHRCDAKLMPSARSKLMAISFELLVRIHDLTMPLASCPRGV